MLNLNINSSYAWGYLVYSELVDGAGCVTSWTYAFGLIDRSLVVVRYLR
jgi:hypothetical protein